MELFSIRIQRTFQLVSTRYTYTKFDKHKNWTERKVSCTIEYDDYDDNMNYIGKKQTSPKEYIENRTVEYW